MVWRGKTLLAAGGVAASIAVLAAPAVERRLLAHPTCFAFVGMRKPTPIAETLLSLTEARDAALLQGAIPKPRPPYVLVTSEGGDVELTNVVLAVKGPDGWEVNEASQPWDRRTQRLLPYQAFPSRVLGESSQRRLERLLAKGCLHREPPFVETSPQVYFDFQRQPRSYDPIYSLIEVHDGERRTTTMQGQLSGITGAIAKAITDHGHGFIAEHRMGDRAPNPQPVAPEAS